MNGLFAHLEREFGRLLASTPKPDPIPEPEAVDCTGVSVGNSDIPEPTWEPPQGEPERPTLPGHEHQADPGSRVDLLAALDDLLAAAQRMTSQCPPAFAGAERRS